jgi:DNA repair photolyase
MKRKKRGVAEWAEHSANLQLGCEHGCRYCYARERALRFKQINSPVEWERPRELRGPAVKVKPFLRRKVSGVVMFPTTHDITPGNVPACRAYLEMILRHDNHVLIVTKPHLEVVQHLCAALTRWKAQIEFRVTIGSPCDSHLMYWEPGAPLSAERLLAAEHIHGAGYKLSFSMEPLLCDHYLLNVFVKHIRLMADSIWIGKMNDVRRRVKVETDEDRRQVEWIEAHQTDERIMEIVRALRDVTQVRFKDSIKEVIERAGGLQ